MTTFVKLSSALTLGVFSCSVASSQAQQQGYARDNCVKVREGKEQEFTAFLRDVTVKLGKVRVDAGVSTVYIVAQAVSPAGRSARCDYHLVTEYAGFPPEAPGPERNAADMKAAGITMSLDAMIAKRSELSYLVGTDTWRFRERVGTSKKGSYVRVNYYKIGAGNGPEWLRLESTGWKPLAEAAAKEHGTAWAAATLAMPAGTNLPYNAMTLDFFPSWAALGTGIPTRALWNKVHPDVDLATHTNRIAAIIERPRTDVLRLLEIITK